jgi:hypothetical protein
MIIPPTKRVSTIGFNPINSHSLYIIQHHISQNLCLFMLKVRTLDNHLPVFITLTVCLLQYYRLTVTTSVARSLTFTCYVLKTRFLPFFVCREQNGSFSLHVIPAWYSLANFILNAVISHISVLIFSVMVLVKFLCLRCFEMCEFLKMSWLYVSSVSFCRFTAALMSTKSRRHTEIFVSIFSSQKCTLASL